MLYQTSSFSSSTPKDMTNTTRLVIVVDLTDDLCGPYLQHIKEFADKHGCQFQLGSHRSEMEQPDEPDHVDPGTAH